MSSQPATERNAAFLKSQAVTAPVERKTGAPAQHPAPVITADRISKAFGAKTLWEELSFDVRPGEMLALTGVSGSGKTTLLNVLGLLEKPDAGTLTIAGHQAATMRQRQRQQLYRNAIAFLFQNYALVDSWTVGQNLDVALEYSKASRAEKTAAKEAALERLGLGGWDKEKVYTLSGGEQQRVALARLLLKEPAMIIADEPTAALDTGNGEIVFEILQELKQQGTAIVLSTHDEAVSYRCDSVLCL